MVKNNDDLSPLIVIANTDSIKIIEKIIFNLLFFFLLRKKEIKKLVKI